MTGPLFVKKTEVFDCQHVPKMLIFRVFAHEDYFFQKTSLLVAPEFRIFLTKNEERKNVIYEVKKEKKAAILHDNHFFVYFCR